MKAQKWPSPAASEREQLLLILRSTRALWKLALEHSSRGKRHHGPNEKLNTTHSSLLAQDLSLLSFEWFENPLFSWHSLQGWDAHSLPSPVWLVMRAPVVISFPLSIPVWGLATGNALRAVWWQLPFCKCAHLCLSLLLSLGLGVLTIVVCKQPKLTDEYILFVGGFAFGQTKNWKIIWVGKGHLAMKLMLLGTGEEIWGRK